MNGGSDSKLPPMGVMRYEWAASILKGLNVLDSGSGHGTGSYLLSKVCHSVTGVEPDMVALADARKRFKLGNLVFLRDGNQSLPLFDAAVSFEVIEHCSDAPVYLDSIASNMKKGGILLISTPNALYTMRNHDDPLNRLHEKEYTPKEIELLLSTRFQVRVRFAQNANASIGMARAMLPLQSLIPRYIKAMFSPHVVLVSPITQRHAVQIYRCVKL